MDKESQDTGFDSDGETSPFFDAVTREETEEAYTEEVLPVGVVPEDKTAAADKNPIANATVDAGKMLMPMTIFLLLMMYTPTTSFIKKT